MKRARPITKTVDANPTRLKWCCHCGRQKAVTEYYTNGEGYPQGCCKTCHRYRARVAARKRYRADRTFREAEKARTRARYRADPKFREAQKANARAWYARRRGRRPLQEAAA